MRKTSKLTEEQRQALSEGQPVYVVDDNSCDQYVLVPANQYQHFQALFESDQFDISDTYPAQEQALGRVWDDPALDEYNA